MRCWKRFRNVRGMQLITTFAKVIEKFITRFENDIELSRKMTRSSHASRSGSSVSDLTVRLIFFKNIM